MRFSQQKLVYGLIYLLAIISFAGLAFFGYTKLAGYFDFVTKSKIAGQNSEDIHQGISQDSLNLVLGINQDSKNTPYANTQNLNTPNTNTSKANSPNENTSSEDTNMKTNSAATQRELEKIDRTEEETSTIKDFAAPVKSKPLREIGNYFSEALGAYIFHAGTDFVQSEGAVIRATHAGTVSFAGPDPILGQKVMLDCGEGWTVTYGGLDNLRVKEGDSVHSNDELGQVGFYPGADGLEDQTQLHYEVWYEDEVQKPLRQ